MTPLALRIAKEATLPRRHRTFADRNDLVTDIRTAHCFEVSGVHEAMKAIVWPSSIGATTPAPEFWRHVSEIAAQTSFLPSPRTWIEWADTDGRIGFLLEEEDGWAVTRAAAFLSGDLGVREPRYSWAFGLGAKGRKANPRNWEGNPWTEVEVALAERLWAAGQTAAQVARALGRSRSAICGLTRRNRERFPGRPEAQTAKRWAKGRRANAG